VPPDTMIRFHFPVPYYPDSLDELRRVAEHILFRGFTIRQPYTDGPRLSIALHG
jgi:hypothetical protein